MFALCLLLHIICIQVEIAGCTCAPHILEPKIRPTVPFIIFLCSGFCTILECIALLPAPQELSTSLIALAKKRQSEGNIHPRDGAQMPMMVQGTHAALMIMASSIACADPVSLPTISTKLQLHCSIIDHKYRPTQLYCIKHATEPCHHFQAKSAFLVWSA